MKLSLTNFRGRFPRVSPRALPDGYAQVASSPRLLSGDLESWRERVQLFALAKSAPINTIFQPASRVLGSSRYWLSWMQSELDSGASNVDVAFGPIPGDTTEAIVFTGAGGPRYTNRSLATDPIYQGSQFDYAYPYSSLRLGIDAPTAAPDVVSTPGSTPDLTGLYTYDGTDISEWSVQIYDGQDDYDNGGWRVETDFGNPSPAFLGRSVRSREALLYRDFSLDTQRNITIDCDMDLQLDRLDGQAVVRFLSVGNEAGPFLAFDNRGNVVFNEGTGTSQTHSGASGQSDGPFHLKITATAGSAYYDVAVVISEINEGAPILSFTGRAQAAGGQLGFGSRNDPGQRHTHALWVDNIKVQVSAPGLPAVPVYSNYVYTIVNSIGWESGPSPASVTVQVDNGSSNIVTIPAQQPGADIEYVNLYRASDSVTDAQYLFVRIVRPTFPATITDTAMTVDIGPSALVTQDFDPPPNDLHSILALPNGGLVGLSGNQVCFSEPGYLYAWPIKYRLTTDYLGVGLGAIDTNVVVLTQSFIYIAQGSSPGSYAMGKLEYPQGCSSKRGIAYISGVGVVFPTPDGLYAFGGGSSPVNLTEQLFAQREWQAMNPSSLIGAAHDDRYFGFYDATSIGGIKAGFILDLRPNGFGFIDIPDHASALYADPITDTLYMVVDDTYGVP